MLRETAMRRGTSTPRPITTHRGSRPDRSETKTNAALDRAPQCTDAERQQIFLTEIAVDVVPEEIPALERQRHPLHRRIVDSRVEAVGVVIIPGIVGILSQDEQNGGASCRERVCQYVSIEVVAE